MSLAYRGKALLSSLKVDEYAALVVHQRDSSQNEGTKIHAGVCEALGLPKDKIFFDASQINDMGTLTNLVARSRTLILLLTGDTLSRPHVLAQVYTALKCGAGVVPVVILEKGYDFAKASTLLGAADLAQILEKDSPGCVRVLGQHGIDVAEMGKLLQKTIPDLESMDFKLRWSDKMRACAIEEIAALVVASAAKVQPRSAGAPITNATNATPSGVHASVHVYTIPSRPSSRPRLGLGPLRDGPAQPREQPLVLAAEHLRREPPPHAPHRGRVPLPL